MSNSSEEYWDVNGVSLNQFCWAIKTFGGSRLAVPKLRGDNVLYPFRDGRSYRPKKADSKVITLAMWVAGIDPGTDNPSTQQVSQFNDNWNALQKAFWSPDEQLVLTRRWWQGNPSPVLKQASTLCELAGTMDPTMTGRTRADFAVDLLLSDPYFYGPELTETLEPGDTVVMNNPGDVTVYSTIEITYTGELVNPRITNETANVWMQLNTAVIADDIEVNVNDFTAINTFDNSNIAGAVAHSGSQTWMKLLPGNNTIKLTSSGNNSGDVTIKYRPAYL